MDARPFVADMCAGGNGNMALALTLVKTLAVVLCVSKLCTHTRNSVVVSKGIIKKVKSFAYRVSDRLWQLLFSKFFFSVSLSKNHTFLSF